jgi:hypothetical protein
MLLRDDLPQAGLEIGVEASAPGQVGEHVPLCGSRLNGRHRFPMAVLIAFSPAMVGRDEDLHAARTSGGEDLAHMLDDVVCLERRAAEFVELAALRQEVVVGIDYQEPRQFGLVGQL